MLRALISSVRSLIISSDPAGNTLRSLRRRTRLFVGSRFAVESLEMRTLLSIDSLSLWRPVDHSSLSGSNRVSYLTTADFTTYSLDAAQMQSALLSARTKQLETPAPL